ncbi:MAG: rRNA adenine dimethyltransferase family protein [Candidatus Levybacteria bacterium]|nr:rRNA adenine dimethyltransferase family protein [Candidatus Levybacteria bacterium]
MEKLQTEGINNFKLDNDNHLKELVLERILSLDIHPNENLGQHFIINSALINQIASFITPGNNVFEIGTGIGQLTEALATKAMHVATVEIDKRYEPVLSLLEITNPNVSVIYGDVLTLKWEKYLTMGREKTGTQLVSSLPYHISEPFFHKLAKLSLSFEDIILILGKRLVDEIKATSEDSADFGAVSLIAQTFFSIDHIATIQRECFHPIPRTESGVVRLLLKNPRETDITQRDYIFRKLYMTEDRNPTVCSIIKNALVEYEQNTQKGTLGKSEYARKNRRVATMNLRAMTEEYNYAHLRTSDNASTNPRTNLLSAQHQALKRVNNMGIPETILVKPFRLLNNSELRLLSKALR